MAQTTKPTHQQVRQYGQARREAKTPPPAPDEIRRQLGWKMIPSKGGDPSTR